MSGPQPDEPNYFVLIAPGADSNDPTPAWTDVSTDLRSVSIRRGADKHLDEDQPGEAIFVLDNYSGDYDNDNTASPYAGQLVTDMRVRVLAEWDGELYERFNGYLDDIELEYPDGDAAAWAVFHATDAFKVLAGAQLPSSAYAAEVLADAPVAWWRLNEPELSITAFDSAGTRPGVYAGTPTLGEEGLIAREADTSVKFDSGVGVTDRVDVTGNVVTAFPFTIEAVVKTDAPTGSGQSVIYGERYGADSAFLLVGLETTGHLVFYLDLGGTTAFYVNSTNVVADDAVHHIAVTAAASNDAKVYVDGVDVSDVDTSTASAFPSGTLVATIGNAADLSGGFGFGGWIQSVTVYDTALSAARIAEHAGTVTTPWDGDTPAGRAHRICDVIGWPDLLRDFDTGESTLQSAETAGQTALEHLLKVAASEFGELHISKEGAILLRSRKSLVNRDPLAEFGPAADEVRYRTVRFASGADLVRNPVTVSRVEGVAQTAEAAATYYPHQFTVDGLYHDSDDLSLSAAQFLLSEFKDQKRRITGVTFGPFDGERLFDWFPLLLEAELGAVYQVTFHPPNGDDLVQVSVLEGTEESWSADTGVGELSWSLSRAYAGGGAFWQLGVHGRSELGVTTRLYF